MQTASLDTIPSELRADSRVFKDLYALTQDDLQKRGVVATGGARMAGKVLLILTLWSLSYAGYLWVGAHSIPGLFLMTLPLTFCTLVVEFAIMHDASHRALAKSSRVNRWFALLIGLGGGSSILWYHKHVVDHHGKTNIPGLDADIDSGGIFRFQDRDAWRSYHRFQHWYALPLYSFLVLKWAWFDDFHDWWRNKYRLTGKRYWTTALELVFSRVLHAGVFLLAPYFVVGAWGPVVATYLIQFCLLGMSMSVVFQLAHVSEVQAFPETDDLLRQDWALHQLTTTADFGVKNRFLTWYVGGLNYQVQHHLFPGLSHVHYPKIQPLVKRYCAERNVPYYEYPSFFSAVRAHFRHLKRLSRRPA